MQKIFNEKNWTRAKDQLRINSSGKMLEDNPQFLVSFLEGLHEIIVDETVDSDVKARAVLEAAKGVSSTLSEGGFRTVVMETYHRGDLHRLRDAVENVDSHGFNSGRLEAEAFSFVASAFRASIRSCTFRSDKQEAERVLHSFDELVPNAAEIEQSCYKNIQNLETAEENAMSDAQKYLFEAQRFIGQAEMCFARDGAGELVRHARLDEVA